MEEKQVDERQQVEAFRNAIVTLAIEQELSFNVLFTGLSQLAVTWLIEFILLTKGELTEEALDEALAKFGLQTADIALNSMKTLKAMAEAENSQR